MRRPTVTKRLLCLAMCLFVSLEIMGKSPIEVSGVRQRAGTKLLDVRYQVSAAAGRRFVVSLSAKDRDSGEGLPVYNLDGDGAHTPVEAGTHRMTWNFGKDGPGLDAARVDVKIRATPLGMVLVEGGTFTMGEPRGSGWKPERPPHKVTVDSFYIGRHEVTYAEVCEVFRWATAQDNGFKVRPRGMRDPVNGKRMLRFGHSERMMFFEDGVLKVGSNSADRPSVALSWYGVLGYCNFRSKMEGLTPCYDLSTWACDFSANGYRLPTEAEWEYAARGGKHGEDTLYSGSDDPAKVAWTSENRAPPVPKPTAPFKGKDLWYAPRVGTLAPNALGIHDMSGNAWEWCWDRYAADYYARSPAENPRGPAEGRNRIERGGGHFNPPEYSRVTCRSYYPPDRIDRPLGFRVVRSADQTGRVDQ